MQTARAAGPARSQHNTQNKTKQNTKVVVLTNTSLEESKRIDALCHAHAPAPIAFIRVETRGVFASVFTDFGPAFTVYDTDGAAAFACGWCCPLLLMMMRLYGSAC